MTIEIFEKHPTADAYKVGAAFTEYCILAKDKRFSDAELAAEWWRARADVMAADDPEEILTALKRKRAITRACTLPHFDA